MVMFGCVSKNSAEGEVVWRRARFQKRGREFLQVDFCVGWEGSV